jgi:hypothetical protein
MALINCFWSYAHADQDHDKRILKLIEDIIGEFKAIVGEDVESYFVDKEQLRWGEEWPEKLDEYINNLPIFIPIITPTYFNKPNCTYELRTFITKLDGKLGEANNALMPILYIDVPELRDNEFSNDLIRRISKTQYIDWTSHRFEETSSKTYRIEVNKIAKALKTKNEEIERISSIPVVEEIPEDEEDDGILEKINLLEDGVQDVERTLFDATSTAEDIAMIITHELNQFTQSSTNKSTSALLSTFNRLSEKLVEPVDSMYENAIIFVDSMSLVNISVPALIQFMEFMDPSDSIQRKSICGVKRSMLSAGENIKKLANSISENIKVIEPFAKMSRSLRPVIRKLVKAFNLMNEVLIAYDQGVKALNTWVIDCDDETTPEE